MKPLAVLLIASYLVSAAVIQAQTEFDSVRFQHLSDSAWHELRSYQYYGWAFQWDSIFLVRWTFWTCDDIHDREDQRRAKEEARLRKKNGEDDAAFTEYNGTKIDVAKKDD